MFASNETMNLFATRPFTENYCWLYVKNDCFFCVTYMQRNINSVTSEQMNDFHKEKQMLVIVWKLQVDVGHKPVRKP